MGGFHPLLPQVPVGGIVIFDDIYDHPDVRAFWARFRRDYSLSEVLSPKVPGPGGVGWFRKRQQVQLDWSKRKYNHTHAAPSDRKEEVVEVAQVV